MSDTARKHGIGIIQDVVLSHIGSSHWWMQDMPTPDWVNHLDQFTPTKHHRVAVQDPYASRADSQNFTTGWFGKGMPDLNQTNPMVATYLIQNNIWWIEYAGLSGLRIDTYGYSDSAFLTEYTRRLMAEYPNLNMVGEEWHKSCGRGVPLAEGEDQLRRLHQLPSQPDGLPPVRSHARGTGQPRTRRQASPTSTRSSRRTTCIRIRATWFCSTATTTCRAFSAWLDEDLGLYKIGIAWLMTMPRIPQFYNGSEILMTSETGARNDASYRRDIPGGWAGDTVDAFSGLSLTCAPARSAAVRAQAGANWRKGASVIHHGKTMHFGAENGTYVFFRYDGTRKVMVAMNRGQDQAVLPTARFAEILGGAPLLAPT
ncbi:cyclomaltodextrinase C-terminal domain-containing protein [Massilia sp. H-1]|nr:cyclomaltodextrinase C-terminal domain-containing protein [Massilia sp. H-1]